MNTYLRPLPVLLLTTLFSPCLLWAGYEFKDQPGDHLDVLSAGRPVARYMYSSDCSTPEKRGEHYKPYLHVFDAEGGGFITKGPGGAFTHHRGIFIGWAKLTVDGKQYDRWHMKGGEQRHVRFLSQDGGERGSFTSQVQWAGDGDAVILEEERTFSFLPPPEGAYALIEMRSKLKAVAGPVVLDGDPEHAGLQFRPANEVETALTRYLYPRKAAEPHKDRDYPWVGESFTLKGERFSVVYLNDPKNPKGTPFSAYRNYGRFGGWFKDTIPAGGERVIRAGFVIMRGELPSAAAIQNVYNAFAGTKDPVPEVTASEAEQPKPKEKKAEPAPAPAAPKPQGGKPQACVETVPFTLPCAEGASASAAASKTEASDFSANAVAGGPAKGPKRAGGGPENPELKFKLPVPPVLSPEEAVARIKLPKGFRAELVASEPMIESPVAVSFDDQGRMYVVEMRGYMHDLDAKGEDQPIGRISRLEDTDGDGRMDKATVFADHLLMPRAVMAYRDGALVGEPPNLKWFRDTDGDGVADKVEVVATDFGKEGGQPEHMVNSPTWMMDNSITMANHPSRYRLHQGGLVSEPTAQGGQWGLTQDDWGRPYFNYNSALLHLHLFAPQFYLRNPGLPSRTGLNFNAMKEGTTWPSHPTPGVNRGYTMESVQPDGKVTKGTLRADGTLRSVTATCGAAIYRGDLFPKEFRGNAFVPEPSANLVKRLVLTEKNGVVTGANAYEEREFLTSTDERFRPVNAYTGPDGALYLVDMARGVIQHKGFLTYYLVANIEDRKLETPISLGRIYRIVPEGSKPAMTKLPKDTAGLVDALNHANGWVRDTAQRVLVERGDSASVAALKELALHGKTPQTRLQALWTLDGIKALAPELVVAALRDKHEKVRAAAVRLADRTLLPELLKLVKDSSAEVRIQLAFVLSPQPGPEVEAALLALLKKGDGPVLSEALVSGMAGRELEFIERLLSESAQKDDAIQSSGVLPLLSGAVMSQRRSARIARLLELVGGLKEGSPRQVALLSGMAGKPLAKGAKPKLVYLDEEPKAFAALMKGGAATKTSMQAIDAVLAWEGKPGVPPAPKKVALNAEQQALFEKGRGIYAGICAGCHQASGTGLEGLAPPLLDSDWVLGAADRPIRILLHGLSGPIPVGSSVWRLEMPALGQLSDEDVASVLTYVRREWEHQGSPVSTAEVSRVRSTYSQRTATWTAEELKAAAKKEDGKAGKSQREGKPASKDQASAGAAASVDGGGLASGKDR